MPKVYTSAFILYLLGGLMSTSGAMYLGLPANIYIHVIGKLILMSKLRLLAFSLLPAPDMWNVSSYGSPKGDITFASPKSKIFTSPRTMKYNYCERQYHQ